MTNKVLLNNVDHADLRVIVRPAAEYGDSVNQVLVFPTEFDDVQREYPIFFRRDPNGANRGAAGVITRDDRRSHRRRGSIEIRG